MTQKLLTAEEFRTQARAGTKPTGTILRLASSKPEAVEGTERTVRFVFSDESVDRAGDAIHADGWDVANFLKNPVALWAHDSWQPPIGRAANVAPSMGKLLGDVEFMPPEVSAFADTVFRMVKAGYINAVSVGFIPLEYTFVNDKDRPFGIDFLKQELLEISVCPVPCNANALVEARAKGIDVRPLSEWAERLLDRGGSVLVPRQLLEDTFKAAKTPRTLRQKYLSKDGADWKCGASRDLPIDDSDSWNGAEAESSIFAYAGGDDFDPEKVRPGFLLYDASAPRLRGSYKEPIAQVLNGELKAVKGGIRAAASRLPQADASDEAKAEARAVIDHYEARMKDGKAMGDGDASDLVPPGNCGRDKSDECGMKDPQQCATHAVQPDPKSFDKSGRRISAKNKALLEKAMQHHADASTCIKAVLDNPDDEPDDDPDQGSDGGDNTPGADDPDAVRAARVAEAKALKSKLT